MIGGTVVQVVCTDGLFLDAKYVEVLDETNFDRQWRRIRSKRWCIEVGDRLWWQSFKGYWSGERHGIPFSDIPIGECRPANDPRSSVEA